MNRDTLPARDETLFIHPRANDRNEWLSPPELIKRLGTFDLDPAAPIVRPWSTAAEHYTIADNGLLKPWYGRVWLNPPYGRLVVPFMERMADHGRGTALVFARCDSRWFQEYVFGMASGLLFVAGRVTFHLPNGARSTSTAPAPVVLAAYGEDDAQALRNSRIHGAHVWDATLTGDLK